MDAIHLHLLLTHIPIVGSFFVAATLFWAALRKDSHLGRFALTGSILVSITAIPVYLAGMAAEEKIEHLPWVTESLIDTHETIAIVSLTFSVFAALVALIIIIINRKSAFLKNSLLWSMFLVIFLQFALLSFTAYRGGLIGHPEIRDGKVYKGLGEKSYHYEDD